MGRRFTQKGPMISLLWRRYEFSENRRIDVIQKNDDVITTSKMSESFWIFFCVLLSSKWTIVTIFTKIGSAEVYFLKIVGNDVIPKKLWLHNDVKNVGIAFKFISRTNIVKMNNRTNFCKNLIGGTIFSEKRRIDVIPNIMTS